MDKEKLMKRIYEDKEELDEREKQIKDVSYHWAFWGVYLVLAIIYVLRIIKGLDFTYDLVMIMMGQAGFMSYSLFKNDRNKRMNMVFIVISIVLFFIATYLTMDNYEII
ncbi:MAG: DUF6442 family protein [Candidatus Izemoplasma sp.]|nr:DUF6442 family protein [Candidatus Izemoplasma sp.]